MQPKEQPLENHTRARTPHYQSTTTEAQHPNKDQTHPRGQAPPPGQKEQHNKEQKPNSRINPQTINEKPTTQQAPPKI